MSKARKIFQVQKVVSNVVEELNAMKIVNHPCVMQNTTAKRTLMTLTGMEQNPDCCEQKCEQEVKT